MHISLKAVYEDFMLAGTFQTTDVSMLSYHIHSTHQHQEVEAAQSYRVAPLPTFPASFVAEVGVWSKKCDERETQTFSVNSSVVLQKLLQVLECEKRCWVLTNQWDHHGHQEPIRKHTFFLIKYKRLCLKQRPDSELNENRSFMKPLNRSLVK